MSKLLIPPVALSLSRAPRKPATRAKALRDVAGNRTVDLNKEKTSILVCEIFRLLNLLLIIFLF
jgi:hypothetical protein